MAANFKTILIAEDEDLNFQLLEMYLNTHNYKTLRASNGKEAVEYCISDSGIDLVLMDIKMPVMDGYEATKRIKNVRPDLPVIVQTAYATEFDRKKAYECGCDDYISKPIISSLLFSKIREQLYKHGK